MNEVDGKEGWAVVAHDLFSTKYKTPFRERRTKMNLIDSGKNFDVEQEGRLDFVNRFGDVVYLKYGETRPVTISREEAGMVALWIPDKGLAWVKGSYREVKAKLVDGNVNFKEDIPTKDES